MLILAYYNKTCVKRPLKKDKTKILMTNGSLMKVESMQYFWPAFSNNWSWKPFYTGFTVHVYRLGWSLCLSSFLVYQVDTFYIEAVSLGHLQRCVIGHDGTGPGEGWYLEQVTIKESDSALEEYVFPCNRSV